MREIRPCVVCGKKHNIYGDGYAWLSGNSYCSSECYDTLFVSCIHCGCKTMRSEDGIDDNGKVIKVDECDKCYLKTRNLTVVRIC